MQKLQGHSLVELLTCLLIGSILLALATPSFNALLLNSKKTQQTNHLLGLLHYARGTAVLDKRTVTLCAGTTQCAKSERWKESLLIFIDNNGNGILDKEETVLQRADLDSDYSWRWSSFRKRHYLTYEHDGTTRALNGTFTLCRKDEALQQIVISLSGRPRTQPAASSPCS